jgi:hypothetical protein
MAEPDLLRLAAVDEEDLAVLSAHLQDAVLKVGDILYLPAERRFAVAVNRFAWETEGEGRRREHQRRRAVLTLDRVVAVRSRGIDRARADAVLSLLAVTFATAEPPAGIVTLVFAGGAAVEIDVEVIEARLADLGAAWGTRAKPDHDADGETPARS